VASEGDADGVSRSVEAHSYRIAVLAPKPIGEGESWRTVVQPTTYAEVCQAGDALRASLLEFGFDADRVSTWFAQWVRCVEYKTTITKERELPFNG
jgi:hypothetical protein